MNISLIAAISINRVIGVKNCMPKWYLSHDLFWFKKHTLYKPIIMGRKTFKSIGNKPLINRLNIVISKSEKYKNIFGEKIIWLNSPKNIDFLKNYNEIMVIGGEQIYNFFLKKSNKIYLTRVQTWIIGDTFFPKFKKKKWNLIFTKFKKFDKNNTHNCIYEIFIKKN